MTPPEPLAKLPESLSVVIPTFKEARRLPATLREVLAYLERRCDAFELIVVDDNSPDGTGDLVREFAVSHPQVRLLLQPSRIGKGAALRRGCLAATGERVLFMDADHATPIATVEEFLPACAAWRWGSSPECGPTRRANPVRAASWAFSASSSPI